MVGQFREISPRLLERVLATPDMLEAVLHPPPPGDARDGVEALLSFLPSNQRRQMQALLEHVTPELRQKMESMAVDMGQQVRELRAEADASAAKYRLDPAEVGEDLGIEKAWHGLHFLLTGSERSVSGPLGATVLGGTEVGPDQGYGPVRYLRSDEVREVAAALRPIDVSDLSARFSPRAMATARVYPGGWDDPESLDGLLEAFLDVRAFYDAVAARGNAILLYVT